MVDVITFLGSDTALVAAIAIAAYAFYTMDRGGMLPWDFLPVSLFFLYNPLKSAAHMVFYAAALYFLLPFLVGLGFPAIYVLIIGLAVVYTKVFELRLEYGAAFSLLTIMIIGTGI
ncbi:MAG: hypothetical protein WCX64_05620 [Candidatus Micrarchaeia archaeon]